MHPVLYEARRLVLLRCSFRVGSCGVEPAVRLLEPAVRLLEPPGSMVHQPAAGRSSLRMGDVAGGSELLVDGERGRGSR